MSGLKGTTTSATGSIEVSFVNRNGGQVLLYAGHQYYKKKILKNGVTIYECNQRRQRCRGSVSVLNNAIIKENVHSHAPDFAKNMIDKKLHEVKQVVSKSQAYKSIPTIYKEALSSLNDDGLNLIRKIPKFKNVKTSLYRKRSDAM
ncbi:PREDICTED: uncharacterized protein LOC106102660 [Papilio polytes]|uniref:uncharacterized protein LOC106102660 n=1 Tax=Papilio polytes TaxID=76194 RepID=UPI0006764608|nr:PREDICTED: uncharacterized protein LOC106102660 [Papilio polytes]